MSQMFLPNQASRQIRNANVTAALQAIFDYRRLSRADLARHLGLNRSSTGAIVAELLESAMVREVSVEFQEGLGRGRPGIMLEIEPRAACFIGVEIGVEHITTLQIGLNGDISHSRVTPFEGRKVPARDAVARAIAQAYDSVPPETLELIEGLGLAIPAQMTKTGFVTIAPILGWENEDILPLVEGALDHTVPVLVENDANAFAFGESYRNPETKAGVTLFLVIESGVGGGIIIDGKLFRGGHGLAGEVGHVLLRDGAELEELLGLQHILQRHCKLCGLTASTLEHYLSEVRNREPKAVEIAEEWARDLATAVVAACRLIDPNRVVLGGGVAALYPLVSARVSHYIAEFQPSTFPEVEIIVHKDAQTGAAFGAACMAHRQFLGLERGRPAGL